MQYLWIYSFQPFVPSAGRKCALFPRPPVCMYIHEKYVHIYIYVHTHIRYIHTYTCAMYFKGVITFDIDIKIKIAAIQSPWQALSKYFVLSWFKIKFQITSIELVKGFLALQLLFNFDIYVNSYDPSKFLKHRHLCGALRCSLKYSCTFKLHLEGVGYRRYVR